MAPIVEKITSIESIELGEGPHWDDSTQSLYFVDIFGGSIHKYTPKTKKYTKAVIDKTLNVSFILPVDSQPNKYLISINRSLAIITWDGISETVSDTKKMGEVDTDSESRGNRINDGKADPVGRVWFGTMGPEPSIGHVEPQKGSLYSYGREQVFRKHLGHIGISNGLAWNGKGDQMYYVDSHERKVWKFDYDVIKGEISNQQTIFTFENHAIPGFPDGMTIDTEGNLWLAVFNGHRVIKINPNISETLLQTIEMPAKQVTSVAFGGENLNELYVTSARMIVDGVKLEGSEGHGCTFVVKGLGVKGVKSVNAKI